MADRKAAEAQPPNEEVPVEIREKQTPANPKVKILDGDSVRLLAVAVLLTAGALLIPRTIPLPSWLFSLGLIGGGISSLTYANDRRITQGRAAYGETAWLSQADLLAVGGLLGIAVTWLLLVPAYFGLLGSHFLHSASWSTLVEDLRTAFTAPVVIGSAHIPFGFLWAGAFTILSTLAYLYILGRGLVYYAALVPLIYVCDVLVGHFVFSDPVTPLEWKVIFPVLLLSLVLRGGLRLVSPQGEPAISQEAASADRRSRFHAWLRTLFLPAALVALMIAGDAATRGTISGIADATRQPFVALTFRAAYFSVFLAYVAIWWRWRVRGRRRGTVNTEQPAITGKAIRLTLVTAVTFGCGYFLRVLAIGSSLAVGPLAVNVVTLVALPLVGAWYATDGRVHSFTERVREAYIGQSRAGLWVVACNVSFYLVLAGMMVYWAVTKLSLTP